MNDQEQHLQREPNPLMDGARGVGANGRKRAFDEPCVLNMSAVIKPPPIINNNFDINISLINMVQNSKFDCLTMINTHASLDCLWRIPWIILISLIVFVAL
ncbi:unnamed protein product [Cochlearia groenlandica]